jgi:5'-nucleotidase (lipoprotein e(P4) family)
LAKYRLDERLKTCSLSKPLAVVVDIDETMLDNSPFETMLINKTDSAISWYDWTKKAKARALPGALDFARYAELHKVHIFYITNRDDNERHSTIENLVSVGFPYADEEHLLTRNISNGTVGSSGSKEERRNKVAENYEIVLLIGDNLNDFSQIFEDRSKDDGKEAVEKNKDLFGNKFIIMPNPMYGAWEKPLYDYKNNLGENEKIMLLKSKLLKN